MGEKSGELEVWTVVVAKAWCSIPPPSSQWSHIVTRTSCSLFTFSSNLCAILGQFRLGSFRWINKFIHSFYCTNELMFEVICERVNSFVRSVTPYLADCSSILFIKIFISFKLFEISILILHFHWWIAVLAMHNMYTLSFICMYFVSVI